MSPRSARRPSTASSPTVGTPTPSPARPGRIPHLREATPTLPPATPPEGRRPPATAGGERRPGGQPARPLRIPARVAPSMNAERLARRPSEVGNDDVGYIARTKDRRGEPA